MAFSKAALRARSAQRKGVGGAELARAEVGGALDYAAGVALSANPYAGARGEAWARGYRQAANEAANLRWPLAVSEDG